MWVLFLADLEIFCLAILATVVPVRLLRRFYRLWGLAMLGLRRLMFDEIVNDDTAGLPVFGGQMAYPPFHQIKETTSLRWMIYFFHYFVQPCYKRTITLH